MKKYNKGSKFLLFTLFIAVTITGFVSCSGNTATNPKVIWLGDSILALSGDIATYIEEKSGETYRKYYMSGAQMVGGIMTPIPTQYDNAKADDPDIRTIIMDGGGNDILIGAQAVCRADTVAELSDECKNVVAGVLATSKELIDEVNADGVQNVIYLSYYHIADGWNLNAVLDYAMDKAKELCEENGVIYIDNTHILDGQTDIYTFEGIHPTAKASKILADKLWEVMVQHNIEQNN